MKLNAISALILYQNIPLNYRRSYETDVTCMWWRRTFQCN